MNAEQHSGTCSCELCQPNWRLGEDDEFQPVLPQAQQTKADENLTARHLLKLREAGVNLEALVMA